MIIVVSTCRKNQHRRYKRALYKHFQDQFVFESSHRLSQATILSDGSTLPHTPCNCNSQPSHLYEGENYTPPLPPNHPTLGGTQVRQCEHGSDIYDSVEGVYSYCSPASLDTPRYQAPMPRTEQRAYEGLPQHRTATAAIQKNYSNGLVVRPLCDPVPPRAPTRRDKNGDYVEMIEEDTTENTIKGIASSQPSIKYADVNSLERQLSKDTTTSYDHRSSQPHSMSSSIAGHPRNSQNKDMTTPREMAKPLAVKEIIPQQPSEDNSDDPARQQGIDNALYYLHEEPTNQVCGEYENESMKGSTTDYTPGHQNSANHSTERTPNDPHSLLTNQISTTGNGNDKEGCDNYENSGYQTAEEFTNSQYQQHNIDNAIYYAENIDSRDQLDTSDDTEADEYVDPDLVHNLVSGDKPNPTPRQTILDIDL